MTVRILFVCLGNICRSPAGEGVMRHIVEKAGLSSKFQIDSAGTGAWHVGEYPDSRMSQAARQRGIDLKSLGRQVTREDFHKFDFVIAMDDDNYRTCQARRPSDAKSHLYPMKEFVHSKTINGIPDPYYGGPGGFENVLDLVQEGCENLLRHIVEELKEE